MTNNQYETLCISNALLGQAKLAAVDAKITETEQALVFLLHARREIVNQYDLNKAKPNHLLRSLGAGPKCEHSANWRMTTGGTEYFCTKCGVTL